jgi:TonB-dependent receptor
MICLQVSIAGTVTGRVTDATTNDYLPGANVLIQGTNYGAATDRTGTFSIPNIPSGDYTLSVQYIGYTDYTQEITVSENIRDNHFEIAMNVNFVELGDVVVAGLRHGEAKALSLQKSNDNISNVIVAEQIEAFPDPNAAEALRRLPGVSIQQDQGEGRYVLIRGTEARLNTTRINGNTIPSPEDDNRNVQLDVIPSDLLGAIEISKALTPDMDADAIGGSVNLVTKNAFDYDGQVLKVDIGGGYKNLRGDLNKKATFTYGNQFMDGKLGVLIGGCYNNSDMATDNIEIKWNDEYEWVTDEVDEIDDGDVIYKTDDAEAKVLDEFEWRGYELNRTRIGLNLNLDYKLNDNSLIYLRFLNNSFDDYEYRHLMNFDLGKSVDEEEPGTGYSDANSVVAAPVIRELKDRKAEATIQSIAVGGKHKFRQIDVDYNFSTSLAKEVNKPSRDVVFEQEGFDIDYNISDPDFPTITVTNGANYNDMSEFEFDEMEYKDGETAEDRDYTGALNFYGW